MKKKLLSVLLSTAMVVTMLMGCGDSGSTGNADNTQTEEPAKEEAAAPAADEEKETAGDTQQLTAETPMLVSATGEVIEPKNGDHYKFGFTEMSAGSFFDACYNGAAEIVEANGDEIVYVEGKADSAYQLGVVEDFIAQGCDAVFYNPSDAAASATAIPADRSKGKNS